SVDSENVNIDTAPIILNNRTMVPISFIVDAFGADYAWGAQTKILSIYY
ncbi:stalk domain-containing protein, partial [Acetoanaerobium noterae]